MQIRISKTLTIELAENIINIFKASHQLPGMVEAGGILLGKVFQDKVIVDTITVPNKMDKAGRFFFKRNVSVAQNAVNKAWAESGGKRIYLGEWHTHSENHPNPSIDDHILLRDMLEGSRMHIDFLIMIIVGFHECCILFKFKDSVKKTLYVAI